MACANSKYDTAKYLAEVGGEELLLKTAQQVSIAQE
jgi:hypothetical protein